MYQCNDDGSITALQAYSDSDVSAVLIIQTLEPTKVQGQSTKDKAIFLHVHVQQGAIQLLVVLKRPLALVLNK